jgi:hypothetical protein
MRDLRMLSLLAITATLVALGAVRTASAATLCENNQTTGCLNPVVKGTTLRLTAEDSIKLMGPFNVIYDTCTESTLEGSLVSGGGGSGVNVTIEVETLRFGSCTRPTTVGSGGTMSLSNITGTDNGTLSSSGMTWTVHEMPNLIGNPPTCSYTTNNTDMGTFTGSTTAPTWDISVTFNSETPGCFGFTWSGHYSYTGSTPFIVSES